MESVEDIVIVGAGVTGLATALGLHRMGIKCLVLESWDDLRVTGYAYTAWTNAWKALDVLGVGDSLRQNHQKIDSIVASSSTLGLPTSQIFYHNVKGKYGDHELRCVRRNDLLEALANELPQGTIRFGAKVVSIVEAKYFKLMHLADGSVLKAKMLIGCDGVNSIVAKSLGHGNSSFLGRSAIRGYTKYPNGHSFEPKFMQFTGKGFRSGFVPCDENIMHWYFTFFPSTQYKDAGVEHDPKAMKQFVLQNLGKVPEKITSVVEQTSVDSISTAKLRFRRPLDVLWPGAICNGNVCVAGDALHAMTPDIGQGGCAALEDAIVLARCVGQVFLQKDTEEKGGAEDEYSRIENCMKKFANERRWRSFELMVTSYVVCMIQGSSWKVIGFVRDRILSRILSGTLVNVADFDCGKLTVS